MTLMIMLAKLRDTNRQQLSRLRKSKKDNSNSSRSDRFQEAFDDIFDQKYQDILLVETEIEGFSRTQWNLVRKSICLEGNWEEDLAGNLFETFREILIVKALGIKLNISVVWPSWYRRDIRRIYHLERIKSKVPWVEIKSVDEEGDIYTSIIKCNPYQHLSLYSNNILNCDSTRTRTIYHCDVLHDLYNHLDIETVDENSEYLGSLKLNAKYIELPQECELMTINCGDGTRLSNVHHTTQGLVICLTRVLLFVGPLFMCVNSCFVSFMSNLGEYHKPLVREVNETYLPLKNNNKVFVYDFKRDIHYLLSYDNVWVGDTRFLNRYVLGWVPIDAHFGIPIGMWRNGKCEILDVYNMNDLLMTLRYPVRPQSAYGPVAACISNKLDGQLVFPDETNITEWREEYIAAHQEAGPFASEAAEKRWGDKWRQENKCGINSIERSLIGNKWVLGETLHMGLNCLGSVLIGVKFNYYVHAVGWDPKLVAQVFKLMGIGWVDVQLERFVKERPKRFILKQDGDLTFRLAKQMMWLDGAFCLICENVEKNAKLKNLTCNACVWYEISKSTCYVLDNLKKVTYFGMSQTSIDTETQSTGTTGIYGLLLGIGFLLCTVSWVGIWTGLEWFETALCWYLDWSGVV